MNANRITWSKEHLQYDKNNCTDTRQRSRAYTVFYFLDLTFIFWFYFQLSTVNITNLMELTREVVGEGINFTNKEVFFSYLNHWFKTGARLLSPVNYSNDMLALNFSQVRKSVFINQRENSWKCFVQTLLYRTLHLRRSPRVCLLNL